MKVDAFNPTLQDIQEAFRLVVKAGQGAPVHLETEGGRLLCSRELASSEPAQSPEPLCHDCHAAATGWLRSMPMEELNGLREGDLVVNLGTATVHYVAVERVDEPQLRCSGEPVSLYRDHLRVVSPGHRYPYCVNCQKPGSSTPAPLGQVGDIVTFEGVTGAYGRPIPGGHELKVNGKWQKVTAAQGAAPASEGPLVPVSGLEPETS